MAALSVHRCGGGMSTGTGDLARNCCVNVLLAATPPLSKICSTFDCLAASIVLTTNTSTIANWKLAATSATEISPC